ncbi:MAG TPA: hypothetical protein VFM36_14485 [Thermoanaerobaculia bacterium]|nr:hypothetical protein [Thermoanaerobaculia bacterium]
MAAAIFAAAVISCRSTVPGTPMAPLRASSSEDALSQLQSRVTAFAGARSLMRVRATTAGKTQSFKAQLVIPNRESMELIAYTPLGTTAVTIRADGDRISFVNHVDKSSWEGSPEDLARSMSIYATSMKPAEMALLLIGLPAPQGVEYTTTPAGLQSASTPEVTVTFDPPQFPPKRVVVRRGADIVEIEHMEIVATQ